MSTDQPDHDDALLNALMERLERRFDLILTERMSSLQSENKEQLHVLADAVRNVAQRIERVETTAAGSLPPVDGGSGIYGVHASDDAVLSAREAMRARLAMLQNAIDEHEGRIADFERERAEAEALAIAEREHAEYLRELHARVAAGGALSPEELALIEASVAAEDDVLDILEPADDLDPTMSAADMIAAAQGEAPDAAVDDHTEVADTTAGVAQNDLAADAGDDSVEDAAAEVDAEDDTAFDDAAATAVVEDEVAEAIVGEEVAESIVEGEVADASIEDETALDDAASTTAVEDEVAEAVADEVVAEAVDEVAEAVADEVVAEAVDEVAEAVVAEDAADPWGDLLGDTDIETASTGGIDESDPYAEYGQPAADPYAPQGEQAYDQYGQPVADPYAEQQHDPYGQPGAEDPYMAPAEQPYDPYGQQTDQQAEQPYDPYDQPVVDPYAPQSSDPYGTQDADPYGAQTVDPYAGDDDNPYASQSSDPYAQPADDPYAQPTADPYAQPADDPYAQPAADPYAQPADDPYAQPADDPYAQPAADPYAQPANDPYAQPAADPYAQPAADPYAQPADDPYAQPAADPYAQPAADPYAQPADDPYAQPADEQGDVTYLQPVMATQEQIEVAAQMMASPEQAAEDLAAPYSDEGLYGSDDALAAYSSIDAEAVDLLWAIAVDEPEGDIVQGQHASLDALAQSAKESAPAKGGKRGGVRYAKLPLHVLEKGQPLVICVTSPKGGAGKTTTSLNLGAYIARVAQAMKGDARDIRVLVIDGDIANGDMAVRVANRARPNLLNLAQYLDQNGRLTQYEARSDGEMGMSDFVLWPESLPNLNVMAAPENPDAFEDFGEDDYRAYVELFGKFYDVIVIDSGTEIVMTQNRVWLQVANCVFVLTQPELAALYNGKKYVNYIMRARSDSAGRAHPPLCTSDKLNIVMMRANAQFAVDARQAMEHLAPPTVTAEHRFFVNDFDKEAGIANNTKNGLLVLDNQDYANQIAALAKNAFAEYEIKRRMAARG